MQLQQSTMAALGSIVKTLPNFLSSFTSDIILQVRPPPKWLEFSHVLLLLLLLL